MPDTPPLITYLTTDDGPTRDAAFLRTYAARVRDRTAVHWEIPNSVAQTLEDIATRIDKRETQLLWQAGDATPLAKFLAEFVTWMRTDEYVHGSGPSEGYRSRREQAEQARELGLKLLTRLDLLETTVTQLAAQLRELA